MIMINYFLMAIMGYLIGSLPTAYLFLKYFKNTDIREEGSGNVGTLNSLRVSKSKTLALIVLLIDFSKGLISVWLAWQLFGENFLTGGVALLFAVIGHCYSVWINFKGGRGLATTGGGGILLASPVILLWIIFWIAVYLYKKNIHFASAASSIFTGILSITSAKYLNEWSRFPSEHLTQFTVLIVLILAVILIQHLPSLISYFREQTKNLRGNRL